MAERVDGLQERLAVWPPPKWPSGQPDRIDRVRGGFVDGIGVRHKIPSELGSQVAVEFLPDAGAWFWVKAR